MAIIYKAKVTGSEVRRVAIFNQGEVPAAFDDWIDCDESVNIDWTYDGSVFVAPPPPAGPTPEELDALAEKVATELVEQDAKFRAVGVLLFQMLRAQKTGNWAYFDSVTNAATFKQLVKGLIRDNL